MYREEGIRKGGWKEDSERIKPDRGQEKGREAATQWWPKPSFLCPVEARVLLLAFILPGLSISVLHLLPFKAQPELAGKSHSSMLQTPFPRPWERHT